MTVPLVSIIVLGYNHRFCLAACFESILQQEYPAIETIYVDNASSDGSSDFVTEAFPQIRIIQNSENLGFAKGNNLGIAQAKGEYVFILNPDTVLVPHCVSNLSEFCQAHPETGICMPKLMHQHPHDVINSTGMTYKRNGQMYHIGDGERDDGKYALAQEVLMVPGASMFCNRKALTKTGGFDESYFAYGEDIELSLRMWWRGWRCVYLPTSTVYHTRNAAAKRSNDYSQIARYYMHRNQYWPIVTYFPIGYLLRMSPAVLVNEARIVARGVFRMLKQRKIPVELKARQDALLKIVSLLQKRRQMRSLKQISTSKFVELLGK